MSNNLIPAIALILGCVVIGVPLGVIGALIWQCWGEEADVWNPCDPLDDAHDCELVNGERL